MFPLRDHNPSRCPPIVTIFLISVNILIYIYTARISELMEFQDFIFYFGVTPQNLPQTGDYNSLFTYMFMHAGFLHLMGNMMFLWVFGDNVEHQLGAFWYLLFYLSCGMAAAIAHCISDPTSDIPLVGASGAIFGVMGAYFLLYPRARLDVLVILIVIPRVVTLSALWLLGGRLALDVFWALNSDPSVSRVAHWAHIGGFAAGFVLTTPIWIALGDIGFWRKNLGAPPHPGWSYSKQPAPAPIEPDRPWNTRKDSRPNPWGK